MTPEQHFEKMMEMFAGQILDPKHHPLRFQYFVELYKHSIRCAEMQDADSRS